MNKLKYLTAVLIAVAGFGFQQTQAHLLPGQEFFTDHPIGNPGAERNFLVANGFMDDCCQFAAKAEAGGGLSGPFSQYFTVTQTTASSWNVSWNLTGTGLTMCGALIKDGAIDQQQLYSFFGVSADEQVVGSGTVSFTSGRGISHIDFFVCRGAGVPDGGATVMLLGAALGSLGMARRFFKK
jgi:hypothetical protein